jgi:hypothetical protein
MAFKPGDGWPPGAKPRPFFHRVARPSVYATDAEALKPRTYQAVRQLSAVQDSKLS